MPNVNSGVCTTLYTCMWFYLVKSVYLTVKYRCDQDLIARLNIAYVALKEYSKDESSVSMLVAVTEV